MYYVYYEEDCAYDPSIGLEEFATDREVVEFVNKRPSYKYRVIQGSERKVKTVTKITKLEME